jgi:IS5 family transposase
MGLEKMLRIYFLQQWFDLSDPQAEDELYDSEAMRRFVGLSLGEDKVPDESTILRFRHLLEEHELTEAMFQEVRSLLEEKQLLLKSGTIVDATIIAAPSSTKNKAKARDPEMRQTKKGNTWHHGMKVHVGTDPKGLVHSLTVTHAAEADINQMPELLHGKEDAIYGDKAYWCQADRDAYEEIGIRYRVNRRGSRGRPLSEHWKKINRSRSKVRALGETPFLTTKRWGFRKVRYRGLAKNRARAFATYALANLYLVRHRLMPPGAKCLQ